MTIPYDPRDPHDDDPLAARLRDALTSEADMVQPSDDGLQNIRSGIDASSRPWYLHPGVLAVAAAVVLGAAVGVGFGVLGGGDGDVTVTPAGDGSGSTTHSPSNSQPDTATPSASPSVGPGDQTDVFVYFMVDDSTSVRLYREQHTIGNGNGDPAAVAALRAMFEQKPNDPDYVSVWPLGTRVRDYAVSGEVATVDLTDGPAGCACVEDEAVQQLVYTVTANDKRVRQVKLLVDGKVLQSEKNDWSAPIARAPMVDVQGLIWLLSPTEDETVSSPVRIVGYGTAFEATISWEVRSGDSDGPVVAEGTTQGGSNGEFGDFTDTVDLPPGTYELRAFESSAKDGSPLHVDTKTFTVE